MSNWPKPVIVQVDGKEARLLCDQLGKVGSRDILHAQNTLLPYRDNSLTQITLRYRRRYRFC